MKRKLLTTSLMIMATVLSSCKNLSKLTKLRLTKTKTIDLRAKDTLRLMTKTMTL